MFNLPCRYFKTPFGNDFISNLISQKIQTKPYKAIYIKNYKLKNQENDCSNTNKYKKVLGIVNYN